jgi:hypothetical protein
MTNGKGTVLGVVSGMAMGDMDRMETAFVSSRTTAVLGPYRYLLNEDGKGTFAWDKRLLA